MSLRVAQNNYASTDAITEAIYFATYNNADIINMSLSGPSFSQSMLDALSVAQSRGITVVVSAGNIGENLDTTPAYPASYNLSNIIPVAALNKAGQLAGFSSFGPNTVKAAAPGTDIYAANLNNSYGNMSGTSFAAPLISAYFARGISENKTIGDVKLALSDSAISNISSAKILGTAVAQDDASYVNSFSRLPNGKLFNIYAKGGEIVDEGYNLDFQTSNYQQDSTLGFATQVRPGVSVTSLPGYTSSYIPENYAPYIVGDMDTLSWNTASGAGGYGLYMSKYIPNSSAGTRIIYQDPLSSGVTYWSFSGLAAGTYYWNTSVWKAATPSKYNLTPVYVFKVGVIPSIPTGLSPASGSTINNTSVTLSWNASTNTSAYGVNVLDVTTNTTVYQQIITITSVTLNNLTRGHNYRWYVQAVNEVNSSQSPDTYFSVAQLQNNAPSVPTVYGSGSVSAFDSYTISMYSTDLESDNIQYTVDWGDGQAQDTTAFYYSGQTATYYHNYFNAGNFCIKVKAVDAKGASSSYSGCSNVTVTSGTPDLAPVSFTLNKSAAMPGDSISATLTLRNLGTANVSGFNVAFYIAPSSVGASKNYQLTNQSWNYTLNANGGQASQTFSLSLPTSGSSAYSLAGNYNIFAVIDSGNNVNEGASGKYNNQPWSSGVDYSSFLLQTTGGSGSSGGVKKTITLSNIGNQTAKTAFNASISSTGLGNDTVSLSAPGGITPNNLTLTNGSWSGPLVFSYEGTQNITLSTPDTLFISNSITVSPAAGVSVKTGSITFKVLDSAGKTPIQGAKVTVTCVMPSACLWSGTTDSSGLVKMPQNTIPNAYTEVTAYTNFIYTDTSGVQTPYSATFPNIISSRQDSYVENAVNLKLDLTHNPVILVPGIMGSADKNFQLDVHNVSSSALHTAVKLPKNTPASSGDLKIVDYWGATGWGKIEDDFTSLGYELNKTIIECPYDWRLPLLYVSQNYLTACINQALSKNPQASKVDIVAHSMGGLVARAYIQSSQDNANKIRRMAFVANPHYGASDAYLMWEGGMTGDYGSFSPRDWTIENVYESMTGKTIPYVSKLDHYTTVCDSLGMNCHQEAVYIAVPDYPKVKDFIQSSIYSVKHLLPIYEFLDKGQKQANGVDPIYEKISTSDNDNHFLHALNGEGCLNNMACDEKTTGGQDVSNSGLIGTITGTYNFSSYSSAAQNIQTMVFYDNTGSDTREKISTKLTTQTGLYPDGEPTSYNKTSRGDGTVPAISVEKFLSTNGSGRAITANGDHAGMVKVFHKEIVSFITGTLLASLTATDIDPAILGFEISGPVQVLVTDPNGKTAGVDKDGNGLNNITGTEVKIESGNNNIKIPNPTVGNYSLLLFGTQTGEVNVSIGYNNSTTTYFSKQFKIYHKSGSQTIPFNFNPAN